MSSAAARADPHCMQDARPTDPDQPWSRQAPELRGALARGDRDEVLRITRETRSTHGAEAMLRLLSAARGFPSTR